LANIKSQIKRNRQNEKRRLRNRDFRGAARTAVKDARASLESGEKTTASVTAAISALDIAAQKGAVHPRNAARRKGRLMKQLAALGMQAKSAAEEPQSQAAEAPAPQAKKPAKVEKGSKPAAEEKSKAKPAPKKTAEKKPAAKKTTAKK
jgi:small subunit ribosomal protein S20